MYADREEADNKLSAKDRLNGSFSYDSGRHRQIAGKRFAFSSLPFCFFLKNKLMALISCGCLWILL